MLRSGWHLAALAPRSASKGAWHLSELSDRRTSRSAHLSERRIVTNAELEVCPFDPADIELATGTLPDADFETVPWVRFRKGLARPFPTSARNLQEANRDKERTVLVVQAQQLAEFLRMFGIKPARHEQWPHIVARELADRQANAG